MGFWSDFSTSEPQRQNRWYMYFANEGLQKNIYALKECAKPSYKVETTQHLLINHAFNYPKNVVWQPIAVKMVSVTGNEQDFSLPSYFTDYLWKSEYRSPNTSIADLRGTVRRTPASSVLGKKSMLDANSKIDILQVDENGFNNEKWTLFNPLITDVNFGSLSYESEGLVEIAFTIVYDFALRTELSKAQKNQIADLARRSAPRAVVLPVRSEQNPAFEPKVFQNVQQKFPETYGEGVGDDEEE